MKIKFFTMELNNVTELKNAYKDLIKKHHPDVEGGSNEDMKVINAEYEFLFNNVHELQKSKMTAEELKKDFHDLNDMFREQIIKVAFLEGVNIEIIGSWVWVSGDTYAHYAVFKNAGFAWSGTKKAWMWYKGLNPARKYRHAHCKDLNEVRKYHHSYGVNVDNEAPKALACTA